MLPFILTWSMSFFDLGKLQKYAICIINELVVRTSFWEYFRSLGILTVCGLYILKVGTYFYVNLYSILTTLQTHTYCTRHKHLQQSEKHHIALYQNHFYHVGFRLHNQLTDSLKSAPNKCIFRARLKTFSIEKYCYSLEEFFNKYDCFYIYSVCYMLMLLFNICNVYDYCDY